MEVHICPIKMRTVKYIDGQCIEECSEEDCPIREEMKRDDMDDATNKDCYELASEDQREACDSHSTWGCTDNKPKKYRADGGVKWVAVLIRELTIWK